VKVIAISGLNTSDVKDRIMGEGADAFFGKPFDFDKLIKVVKEIKQNWRTG